MLRRLAAATIAVAAFVSDPASAYLTMTEELLTLYDDGTEEGRLIAELFTISYADGFTDCTKIGAEKPRFCVPKIGRPALATAILHWINHADQQWLRDGKHTAGFSVVLAMNALYRGLWKRRNPQLGSCGFP